MEIITHIEVNIMLQKYTPLLSHISFYKHESKMHRKAYMSQFLAHRSMEGHVWSRTGFSCSRLVHVADDLRVLKVSLTNTEWIPLQCFLSSERAKHFLDIPKSY